MDINSNNTEIAVFQDIYKKYYAELCRYALKFVFTPEDAEEIVQSAIVKIWERKDTLNAIANLRQYLFRMVHNDCLNYLKHLQTKENYKNKAELALKLIEVETSDSLTIKELENDIDDAISSLPEKCREVFVLRRMEDLSLKEIATKLDISPKTVEVFITKALKHMHKKLQKHLMMFLF